VWGGIDLAVADESFSEALKKAKRAGDRRLELCAYNYMVASYCASGEYSRAVPYTVKIYQIAEQLGHEMGMWSALFWQIETRSRTEGYESVEGLLPRFKKLGERTGTGAAGKIALLRGEVGPSLKQGRWSDALKSLDEAYNLPPAGDKPDAVAARSYIALFTGKELPTQDISKEAASSRELNHGALSTLNLLAAQFCYGASVRHIDGYKILAESILLDTALPARFRAFAHETLGIIAMIHNDQDKVAAEYAHISDAAAMLDHGIISIGLMARSIGKLDESIHHCQSLLGRAWNGKPEQAWIRYYVAETRIIRNNPGDRDEARELLKAARESAQEMEMAPLLARAGDLFDREFAGRNSRAPDGLTEREMDVLRQLTTGKTDQEIADALFISPKTVSNHVGNILRKTKTGNRTEAAHYAANHELPN
jgi:DNA-binding CsgD family transcriptional regulator